MRSRRRERAPGERATTGREGAQEPRQDDTSLPAMESGQGLRCVVCGGPIRSRKRSAKAQPRVPQFCRKRCGDTWSIETRTSADPPAQARNAPTVAQIRVCRRCGSGQFRADDYGKVCQLCGELHLARDVDWGYMQSRYISNRGEEA